MYCTVVVGGGLYCTVVVGGGVYCTYLPTIQGFPGLSRDLGSDPGIQGFLQ